MEVIISSILYTFFFSITLQHLIALIHIYRIAANELTIQSGLFQSAEPGRTTKLSPVVFHHEFLQFFEYMHHEFNCFDPYLQNCCKWIKAII